MKVNILGVDYKIFFKKEEQDIKLENHNGYIDHTLKEIVIKDLKDLQKDERALGNLNLIMKQNLRHEIIHGFFYESGLWFNTSSVENWATNEEMVDWISIQFPKILKAFKEVDAI